MMKWFLDKEDSLKNILGCTFNLFPSPKLSARQPRHRPTMHLPQKVIKRFSRKIKHFLATQLWVINDEIPYERCVNTVGQKFQKF